jgi:PGF-pre-PGF domain-containing protein
MGSITGKKYFITVILLAMAVISPACAFGFNFNMDYVGLDKVDLSWYKPSVQGFQKYEVVRDGEVIITITDYEKTSVRNINVPAGSHSYQVKYYADSGWDFSTTKTADVGHPGGTIKLGSETWKDETFSLGGDVSLGGNSLDISGCTISAGDSPDKISGTGELEISGTDFDKVEIDVTAPGAVLNDVSSNKKLAVRGGGITASDVQIPGGNYGENQFRLYGDDNRISECNAEIHLQGDNGIIERCEGQWTKIYATGDNNTIKDNNLRDVRGYAIYASGNATCISSNNINNASNWETYSTTYEYGRGISLSDCANGTDIYKNTITDAKEHAIYAVVSQDGSMKNYNIESNTITGGKYGIFTRAPVFGWNIFDNRIDDCSDWMLYNIGNSEHAVIRGNSFENISRAGFNFHGNYSSIVENNFYPLDTHAMSVSSDENGGFLVISGNTITGIREDDKKPDGIDISAANSVVEENIIQDCRNGIDTSYKENLTIRNNEFYDNWGEWGIYFYDSYNGTIENNTFTNPSLAGNTHSRVIYLYHTGDVAVRNNMIDDSGSNTGIYAEYADDGIVIEDNTIKNVKSSSVYIDKAEKGSWESNYKAKAEVSVLRNIIDGGYTGISCKYVDNVTIEDNNIVNKTYGIVTGTADSAIVSGNNVAEVKNGISVDNSDGTTVNGNIFNVTDKGGVFRDPLKNITVAGNSFSGYSDTGIEIEDCEATTFSGNLLNGEGWDIYLKTSVGEPQDTLLLEENTVGIKNPTTFTLTDPNEPVYIRGVENPPDTPSPPDYQTTKSSIGKWLEVVGEGGKTDVQMNLTFHYTADDVKDLEESTLSVWKYNGTAWDPGSGLMNAWNGTRWHDLNRHEIGVEVEKLCIFAPLGGLSVHNLRIPRDYETITEALDDFDFQDGDTITVDEGYSGTEENIEIGAKEVKLKASSGTPASVTLTALDPYRPTVLVRYSDNVEIDGFVITGATSSQGVKMVACEDSKVTNSRIEGNFFGAIIAADDYKPPEKCINCKITDCTITGNDHGAVYINSSDDCVVIDCTLSGAVGVGLERAQNAFISGNTLKDCADYGITDNFGKNNEITGNTVTGGRLGFYLYESESDIIKENSVTDTTGPGIVLEKTEECTFTGNSVTGSPLGIACEESDTNTFTGTVISGKDAGGSELVGIDLKDSDSNTFTRCTVSDLKSVGYAVTGLVIEGAAGHNTFDTCTFSGFEASRADGVRLAASGNSIINSTFTDFRGAAGGASAVFNGVNSTGNIIRKCSVSGIYAAENATAFRIEGAKHLTIKDCTAGAVNPENTSSFVIFKDSEYSNVIESTAFGNNAEIHELRAAGDLTVSNTTDIPPDGDGLYNIGHYLNLSTGSSAEAWLSFDYTDEDLSGKDPALLSVWRNDGSEWQQVSQPNGVNTAEHYVYADNITEFSVFAPMWSGKGLPVANFTAEPTEGNAPLRVVFTDRSKNAVTWQWDFGDGTHSSDRNPPIQTYNQFGIYNVSLRITGQVGSDTCYKLITVRDVPPDPSKKTENMTLKDNGTKVFEVGGKQQVSFNSSESSGGEVSGDNIILRNNGINVTITTDGLTNTSGEYSGNVTGVNLSSDPLTSDIGGSVGNASFSFNASMPRYNPDAVIETSMYERPGDSIMRGFNNNAQQNGFNINSTAYAVYITKSNFTENDSVSNAVLRFTAGNAWVNANGGTGAVRVMRAADNGACEMLPTVIIGIDRYGNPIFAASSPDGFSAFAMVAVSAVPSPAPGPSGGSSSSSGGGGSGGDTVASSSGSVKAGVPAAFTVKEGPVYEADIKFNRDLPSVLLTVNTRSTVPPGVQKKPDLEVYRYLTFELYKADPSDVSSASIRFAVPLSTVSGREVLLLHYTDGKWIRLPTVKTGEKDGSALYSAETPSLSSFAIAFDKPAEEVIVAEKRETDVAVTEKTDGKEAPVPAATPGFGLLVLLLASAGSLLLLNRKRG